MYGGDLEDPDENGEQEADDSSEDEENKDLGKDVVPDSDDEDLTADDYAVLNFNPL